jgi:ribosomal protein S18 acetylase RimI-like enzyme
VAAVWHRSGQAAYRDLPTWQAFTLEQAQRVFAEVIQPHNTIWVAIANHRIVAYLALNPPVLDRLYVDPSAWRQGWGTRLVQLAQQLSPTGLRLVTHQTNVAARALYERHGFQVVSFGISPAPESAPDVTYHWRPDTG